MEQLRYSIYDLTGIDVPLASFPSESHRDGFVTFAALQVSSQSDVRAYMDIAESVAGDIVLGDLVDCTAYDAACLDQLLNGFGRRVFRRPMTAEEKARYVTVYDTALPLGDEQAMRFVLRGLLSSPQFLYRTQAFAGERGQAGYAVAEKLSYFLWSSTPDEALLAAAETGALDDAAGRREMALQMLADPKAQRTVDAFHRMWLRLDELAYLSPDPEAFPEYSDELADAYAEETLRFTRETFFGEDSTLVELLTANTDVRQRGPGRRLRGSTGVSGLRAGRGRHLPRAARGAAHAGRLPGAAVDPPAQRADLSGRVHPQAGPLPRARAARRPGRDAPGARSRR